MSIMKIILSNDDGIDSPGLLALAEILSQDNEVTLIAPERERSAISHAITLREPVILKKKELFNNVSAFAATGTPADCVKIALYALLPKRPDMLIAGINHGTNTSVNVIYSGTMGAVMEGCTEQFPAIGFSLDSHDPDADFEPCRHYIRQMVRRTLSEGLPEGVCLNINFPVRKEFSGVRVVRQCRGRWNERFVCRIDPAGREYYWLTGEFLNYEPDAPDTDEAVMKAGYVSVVPCQIDMTHKDSILKLHNWNDN